MHLLPVRQCYTEKEIVADWVVGHTGDKFVCITQRRMGAGHRVSMHVNRFGQADPLRATWHCAV